MPLFFNEEIMTLSWNCICRKSLMIIEHNNYYSSI